jgi:ZIP family zinc transporter
VAEALLWGVVAGMPLLLGAWIAMTRPPGRSVLGMIMAFGSGVLLSAVAYELVAESVEATGRLRATTVGVLVGALAFTAGDRLISRASPAEAATHDGAATPSGLSIVLGALLDGIPESAVLGLTLVQVGEVQAALLVAVILSNVPEGIAATIGLRTGGWTPAQIVALWSGVVVACGLSAAGGYLLLEDAAPVTLALVLAFAGGAILTTLATAMIPEAYEHAGRAVGLATVVGFSVALGVNWLQITA